MAAPIVAPDGTFRQPIHRLSVLRPPQACRFIRVPLRVLVGISGVFVCLRSPSGILRDLVFFGVWSRKRSAPSSVARVCLLTPLLFEGNTLQHYAVYLIIAT